MKESFISSLIRSSLGMYSAMKKTIELKIWHFITEWKQNKGSIKNPLLVNSVFCFNLLFLVIKRQALISIKLLEKQI